MENERDFQSTTGMFRVSDIYQAGFLITRGRQVAAIRHRERFYFFFERTAELEADLSSFHMNAPIPVRDFLGGIHAAKRMLREQDQERSGRE